MKVSVVCRHSSMHSAIDMRVTRFDGDMYQLVTYGVLVDYKLNESAEKVLAELDRLHAAYNYYGSVDF